jgi:hypothetical protein
LNSPPKKKTGQAKRMMNNEMQTWTLLNIRNTKTLFPLEGFRVSCWIPTNHHDIDHRPGIVLYGGMGPLGRGNNNIYILRDRKEGWKMQPTTSAIVSKGRMDHGMCIINNCLYLFGGRSGMSKKPLREDGHVLYRLNLESFEWSIIPSRAISHSGNYRSVLEWLYKSGSPIARYGHSMNCSSLYAKHLFVFGGVGYVPNVFHSASASNQRMVLSELNDFWAFNTITSQWQSFEMFRKSQGITGELDMGIWPRARYGHVVSIVNDALYIIGGSSMTTGQSIKDIWRLDLKTMRWKHINIDKSIAVYIPIRDSSSVVFGSKILLYGGLISKSENLSSLLVFNTVTEQIGMIASSTILPWLPNGLLKHVIIQYGLNIWVLGGKQRDSSLILGKWAYNTNIYQFSLTIPAPAEPKVVSHTIQNPQTGKAFEEKETIFQVSEAYLVLREQKLDLISELLKSNERINEYASVQALDYIKSVVHSDTMKAIYTNANIQQALIKILSSGADDQVIVVASILKRYIKDTDQGIIPISVAMQMLKFIESYLTHVSSVIRTQDDSIQLKFEIYDQYMNLFSELAKNFDYYQSISKQIVTIFSKVFQLSNINHVIIEHIVNIVSEVLLFLVKNAQNFVPKCKKSLCKAIYKYLSAHYQLVEQQRQLLASDNDIASLLVTPIMEQTASNILESIYILSRQNATVRRQLDYFIGLYEAQIKNQ